MSRIFFLIIIAVCLLISCKEEEVDFSLNNCKRNPGFIQSMGFNPGKSYLSTSEEKTMGLVLIESEQPGNPHARKVKIAQQPSWRKAGWLAPILLDEKGNIYTAPAPFITVFNNPISNNNTIYKVDNATGEMNEFLRLPFADSINPENPFGIVGMAYLCETHTLYITTVAGSRRYEENGNIYAVNIETGKIIDKMAGVDALGLGITYITGKRELYFGLARSSDIMSVSLNKEGKFSGSPAKSFSLSGLGPRGDDKVRKIRTDQNGNLVIHGMEFNFNLIAPREKQETVYNFFLQHR
ncbi:MAG: PQQ-like beta-propeller repeat protein [Chitinophagaceae bacterium]|nr:PQQ-like beta-propeller repeat protein [Chitinophagaceae bacterium]